MAHIHILYIAQHITLINLPNGEKNTTVLYYLHFCLSIYQSYSVRYWIFLVESPIMSNSTFENMFSLLPLLIIMLYTLSLIVPHVLKILLR